MVTALSSLEPRPFDLRMISGPADYCTSAAGSDLAHVLAMVFRLHSPQNKMKVSEKQNEMYDSLIQ